MENDMHHRVSICAGCMEEGCIRQSLEEENARLTAELEEWKTKAAERTEQLSRENWLWERHREFEAEVEQLKNENEKLARRTTKFRHMRDAEVERLTAEAEGTRKVKQKEFEIRESLRYKVELVTADNAELVRRFKSLFDGFVRMDLETSEERDAVLKELQSHHGQAILDRLAKLEAEVERVTADNAACIEFIRHEADVLAEYLITERSQEYSLFAAQDHPGQALLDRLEKAEAEVESLKCKSGKTEGLGFSEAG